MDFYQVDVFADPNKQFTGNPAVVYILNDGCLLETEHMVALAESHNAPATTFVFPLPQHRAAKHPRNDFDGEASAPQYGIRWFLASGVELPLCGHGTMAATFILYHTKRVQMTEEILFETSSGTILKARNGVDKGLEMELPVNSSVKPCARSEIPNLEIALGTESSANLDVFRFDGDTARPKLLLVLRSSQDAMSLRPNFNEIAKLDDFGVVITAGAQSGENFDFVTRYFVPKADLNEDTATGSIHCALFPFWKSRLAKETKTLHSFQSSKRTGYLSGTMAGDSHILVGGFVRLFASGTLANGLFPSVQLSE